MPASNVKKIAPRKEEIQQHTHRDNWEVMKPFVHFSVKAAAVIGTGLIAVVRALPLLKHEEKKNTTIVKK